MRIFRRHDRDTHLDQGMTGDDPAGYFGLNRSVSVALLQTHKRSVRKGCETS